MEWQQHNQNRFFSWQYFMGLAVSPNELLNLSAPISLLSQQLGVSLTQCGTSKYCTKLPPLNLAPYTCPLLPPCFPFLYSCSFPPALPPRNGFHLIQACLATDFFCPTQESRACWGLVEQYIKIWSIFLLIWCSDLTAQLELSPFGISWREWGRDTPLSKPLHCDEWKWAAMLCPASRQPNKNINSLKKKRKLALFEHDNHRPGITKKKEMYMQNTANFDFFSTTRVGIPMPTTGAETMVSEGS